MIFAFRKAELPFPLPVYVHLFDVRRSQGGH